MGWKKGTALKLYEASFQNQRLPLTGLKCLFKEITPRVIKFLDPTPIKFQGPYLIRSGDIICFQKME
jgi:hypothetical protein